jgi:hypothetical protein
MVTKRWQDPINALLGLWMMVSPWALGLIGRRTATPDMLAAPVWSGLILGAAIVMCAVLAMSMPKFWEEAVNAFFGLCLAASPWALGFSTQPVLTANAVLVGLLATGVAVWAMMSADEVQHWLQEHHWGRS